MKKLPPTWIQSILHRFADEDTAEEVEGDLLEFYQQWRDDSGKTIADWTYFFTAITMLRPFKRKRKELSQTASLIMIKSYFIMSWRTILKNKVSSLINISGLTLGLTTCLLVLLVVVREFEYDQQHAKKDSIFLMMKNQKTNDGVSTGRATPGPMAETIKAEYPQVERTARVTGFGNTQVVIKNKKFSEAGVYADPDIFRMMTFPAIKGDAAKSLENNSIVLTKSTATKLFGDRDPVGEIISLGGQALTIGAVIEDIPQTNSLKFTMAVPFRILEEKSDWLRKWDDNRIQTWVELRSKEDLDPFNEQVSSLLKKKTDSDYETVFAYPLTRLHLYGGFENGKQSGGMITLMWLLIGFGAFMLLIACINFMNLATAQSSRRAREVGVRKVLGAARRWIIFQFLNESFVITILSLVLAIALCVLIIPSFNVLLHASIAFEFTSGLIWVLCLTVAIVTSFVAGSYPALVLSRFAPVRVLKGVIDRPGGLSLRRLLVTFQFIISIAVIIGTIILYAQFDYVKKRPLGYEQENLIQIPLDSVASAKFNVLKYEVLKVPGVRSVTGTGGNILYTGGAITGMDWPGKKPGEDLSVSIAEADYDWSRTMGIEITSGRDFSADIKSDEQGCLINQAAVDKMGLINPVGSVVGGHVVLGVFKNFVYNDPSGVIAPMMVFLSPPNVHHLYVRLENKDSWTQTLSSIETAVKSVSPDIDFDFRFTVDDYQSRFEELYDGGLMVSIFGGMTIFISCLGLFGLSGFVAERRSKEMSIRKVFGANNIRVLVSLSSDILKPVIIALLIVTPVSIWVAGVVLQQFVYRVSLQWWMFALAGGIVVVAATIVVLYHAQRTAVENPSVRLRSE